MYIIYIYIYIYDISTVSPIVIGVMCTNLVILEAPGTILVENQWKHGENNTTVGFSGQTKRARLSRTARMVAVKTVVQNHKATIESWLLEFRAIKSTRNMTLPHFSLISSHCNLSKASAHFPQRHGLAAVPYPGVPGHVDSGGGGCLHLGAAP